MAQNEAHQGAHQCAQCPEPANLVCSGCKGAPDGAQGTLAIWYCTRKCQKDDWKTHKQACKTAKDRQTLYRAADTAQKMLLIFSRETFVWGVERIEKRDGEWLVHQTSPEKFGVKSQLQDFPSKTFSEREEQLAILTYQNCDGALAYLHDFLKILLKGPYSKIEEVSVWIKNASFRMRRIFHGDVIDRTDYKHSILRVTTRAGEKYALDMTGAQFGWTKSVLPWDLFADTRILSVGQIKAFGYTKPYIEANCIYLGEARSYIHYIQKSFANVLDGLLYEWQKANMLLPMLLVLPHEEFKKQQQALIEHVEEIMQRFREFAISTDQFPVMGGDHGSLPPEFSRGSTFQLEKFSI